MSQAMAAPSNGQQAALGLGRPGDSQPPATLTASLSLSSLAGSSDLSHPLSPLASARARYQSAAQLFLQRNPVSSLTELAESKRLLLDVVAASFEGSDVNGTAGEASSSRAASQPKQWESLREKVAILWITLLVSLWKSEDATSRQAKENGRLSATPATRILEADQPGAFLQQLTADVLAAFAMSKAEREGIPQQLTKPNQSSLTATSRSLLPRLPASVAASLIMGSISIEEKQHEEKRTSTSSNAGSADPPPPVPMPMTKQLAENLLTAQSKRLDELHEQAQYEPSSASPEASSATLAAYARVLELYAIHVLGVREGQWEYADQVVRLSLLEDEVRAKLLMALSRAHQHILTRPQRRASAALAQQKAYEAEKSRRTSEATQRAEQAVKAKEQASKEAKGPAVARSSANAAQTKREPLHRSASSSSSSTPTLSKHANGAASIAGSESAAASASPSSLRKSNPASSSPTFASTRSHLSQRMDKDRARDAHSDAEAEAEAERPASSSSSSSSVSRRSSATWSAASLLSRLQKNAKALTSGNIPAVLSTLLPILVLFFSLRRLLLGRRLASGGTISGGAATEQRKKLVGSGSAATTDSAAVREMGLLRRAVEKVWGTVKMGTQVTYL